MESELIAICPQPSTVSTATATPSLQRFTTRRLRSVTVRPVQRDDWLMMGRFYRALSCATLQRRFHCAFSPVGSLSEARIGAMTAQLMALERTGQVLVGTVSDAGGEETAVAHAGWITTELDIAEFALVVADDYQREGIGKAMMLALIEGARQRDVGWLQATVIEDNVGMLQLMRRCGLWCASTCNEDGLIDVQGFVGRRAATQRTVASPANVRARVQRRCRTWFDRALGAAA